MGHCQGRPSLFMSSKKLQTEIDRTLKKVTEGLEIFHETLDKLNSATTQNQKEKYEVDLKKEIKKLQRLRDTIKGWQSSSEIKDKQPINDARKSIETQMEKFKVLEKEMKIKAFSKEGLNQTTKLDPKMKEKLELANWINSTVDRLNTQIDAYEAEVETINLTQKKGKKLESTKQERCDLLVSTVEKHKNHIQKLEAILRLMQNDHVSNEQVSPLKEELEYYIESNLDDDFMENEELYDEFDFSNAPESDSDISSSDDEPVSRKKSIDVPSIAKTVPPVASNPPSGIKSPPVPLSINKIPLPVPASSSKESQDIVNKAISPPASIIVPSQSSKITGPSFASALAAASAQLSSQVLTNNPNASSISPKISSKKFNSGAFEELESFFNKKFPAKSTEENTNKFLSISYQNIPDNYELERNRQFCPKQPYAMPSYYQSEPPQILNNPSIFERFDLDTLFFIFYYQQKTYPQYLAARELKKQSWRFHKKYLTWFQRHEEPKVITNDYEQGTYIYFDYEGSWCQRKKTEFTFEYRYLEDEELI